MDTPSKRTPQLSVTRNLDVRIADRNSKSMIKMFIVYIYRFDIGAFYA